MTRDFALETENRVTFIRRVVKDAGAKGIVFANSGGKDCALVGILSKMACDNTTGVLLPCQSKRNYAEDYADAMLLSEHFGIKAMVADLGPVKAALVDSLKNCVVPEGLALCNINPRLRMTAMYAIGQATGCLVAGTGNRSEIHLGYFTKWGDGAFDFNPILDLTATEIFAFLRHLGAPERIIDKAPSAGLYEGQTDEADFGFTYDELDTYLTTGKAAPELAERIDRLHAQTEHKRKPPLTYTK